MTNPETLDILSRLIRNPSSLERLRKRIRTTFMSRDESEHMKSVIIRDAKPLYVNSRSHPWDWEDRLAISCFDERINSLPRETLLDVYTQVERLRSARSAEAKRLLLERLLITLSLSHSIDGWFRSKMVQYAMTLNQ